MNSMYASASMTQNPPHNTPKDNDEYVNVDELIHALNALIIRVEESIIKAKNTLNNLNDISLKLDKNSEEYYQLITNKEIIEKGLHRTNEDDTLSLGEIHYLATRELDGLFGKKQVTQSEYNRIHKNILNWNGYMLEEKDLQNDVYIVHETNKLIKRIEEKMGIGKEGEIKLIINDFLETVRNEYLDVVNYNDFLYSLYQKIQSIRFSSFKDIEPEMVKSDIRSFYEKASNVKKEIEQVKEKLYSRYQNLRQQELDLIEQIDSLSYDNKNQDIREMTKIDTRTDLLDSQLRRIELNMTRSSILFFETLLDETEKAVLPVMDKIRNNLLDMDKSKQKEEPTFEQNEKIDYEVIEQPEEPVKENEEELKDNKKNYKKEIIKECNYIFMGNLYRDLNNPAQALYYFMIKDINLDKLSEEEFQQYQKMFELSIHLGFLNDEERTKAEQEINNFKETLASKKGKQTDFRTLALNRGKEIISKALDERSVIPLVKYIAEETEDQDWSFDTHIEFELLIRELVASKYDEQVQEKIEGFKNHFINEDTKKIEL